MILFAERIVDGQLDAEAPEADAEWAALAAAIDKLRGRLVEQIGTNEANRLAEGATEIHRRRAMASLAEGMRATLGASATLVAQAGEDISSAAAAATEESAASIADIVRVTQHSSETAEKLVTQADTTQRHLQALESAADDILRVADLIERVAGKTNILALNATIEAVRAGEAGRSFGVVAKEVQNLSLETRSSTKQVREHIQEVQRATNSVVGATNEIRDSLGAIARGDGDIATAVANQSSANDAIVANVGEIDARIDRIRGFSDAMGAAIAEFGDQSTTLLETLSAEPGVTENVGRFGQSAPLTGAAVHLGAAARDGVQLAFAEINQEGVHGRHLELRWLDDGYNPEQAVENVRAMVRAGDVFAFLGAVGAPTSKLTELVARGGGIPFIGPVTGASFLRAPEMRHVVNVRASDQQEATRWSRG